MTDIHAEISWLRADAARFRKLSGAVRRHVRNERNPVERIRMRSRAAEYTLEAKKRDERIAELRAQLGIETITDREVRS